MNVQTHPTQNRARGRGRAQRRAGVVIPVTVSLTVILGMGALAVDVGRLYVVRSEMQTAADAAALAGANRLLDEDRLKGSYAMNTVLAEARDATVLVAQRNPVAGLGPVLNPNPGNDPAGDVVVGYLADPENQACQLEFTNPERFNTVRALIRRDEAHQGSIALLFARIFGYDSSNLRTAAAATFEDGVAGFRIQQPGTTVDLLPFALQKDVWDALLAGGGDDNYSYNQETRTVGCGQDGVREVNLYPGAGTGQLPPGNFGTVDIGSPNNSTCDISRQIRYGVSEADLAWHGGELVIPNEGPLPLNGDTGLSAAVKDDLEAIKGMPRMIPLFSTVAGNGNNAQYNIVAFAGVRVMYVKLTGSMSSKKVIVQPAVVTSGAAVTRAGLANYYVYRPVMLSR
ncbi:MAG: pilus assembly protein TadG-related protein [Planctomycetota bacterium]